MTDFHLGGRVILTSGARATIVGIIERGEYARDFEVWRWISLTEGLIVLLDEGTFVHVRKPQFELNPAVDLRPQFM